jgi:hypothetical protein
MQTEATKTVLQYLSEVAGSVSGVEQQILQSNPILEGTRIRTHAAHASCSDALPQANLILFVLFLMTVHCKLLETPRSVSDRR